MHFGSSIPAFAHPVPRSAYDRTIVVRLRQSSVQIDYQLEVDPWTIVFQDLPAVLDREGLAKLSRSDVRPAEFYGAFTAAYAPLIAAGIVAKLDGQPLTFRCLAHKHEVLDHVRCTFVFEAPWRPSPGDRHDFTLREDNYGDEEGLVRLSVTSEAPVVVASKTEPDEATLARSAIDRKPGDRERLRNVAAKFTLPAAPAPPAPQAEPIVALQEPDLPEPQGPSWWPVVAMVVLTGLWALRRSLRIASEKP